MNLKGLDSVSYRRVSIFPLHFATLRSGKINQLLINALLQPDKVEFLIKWLLLAIDIGATIHSKSGRLLKDNQYSARKGRTVQLFADSTWVPGLFAFYEFISRYWS